MIKKKNNFKKFFFILIFILIIITIIYKNYNNNNKNNNNNEFKVGMEIGYTPFNWIQNNNKNNAIKIQNNKNAFANGYDIKIAKKISNLLNKKLVITQIKWDGLVPALQSKKIDAIIAGMSPTKNRKKEISFTSPYYKSNIVIIINKKNKKFNSIKNLKDLKNAKITAQLNTIHYDLIKQIPNVKKQQAMENFSNMRAALKSNIIDCYISEMPEGITVTNTEKNFKMIKFKKKNDFKLKKENNYISIGMRKNDNRINKINNFLINNFSEKKQNLLMDQSIKIQPKFINKKKTFLNDLISICKNNYKILIKGTISTIIISIISTIIGFILGLIIGVFKTIIKSKKKIFFIIQKIIEFFFNIYIKIFRGTPMMVQTMIFFYGLALIFKISLNKTLSAILIVSINTGAYMSEIIRNGIISINIGQFEAAKAIGMKNNQIIIQIIFPQMYRNILPAIGNELLMNIKDTTALNVIGVTDLFFQGNTIAGSNFKFFQTFIIIGIIYFIITSFITYIFKKIEKKINYY